MTLTSKLTAMERAVGAIDDGEPQCPHSRRFLGHDLPCPDGGCGDGSSRAKEIILKRLALMESRMRSQE
jgi:hypothetical protein